MSDIVNNRGSVIKACHPEQSEGSVFIHRDNGHPHKKQILRRCSRYYHKSSLSFLIPSFRASWSRFRQRRISLRLKLARPGIQVGIGA